LESRKSGAAEGSASTTPFIEKAGTAEGSAIISSTKPFIGKAGTAKVSVIISSPIEVFEKAGAAESSPIAAVISPTIGLDVKACEKIIREKLLMLKKRKLHNQVNLPLALQERLIVQKTPSLF
jgi:hypothetical protein